MNELTNLQKANTPDNVHLTHLKHEVCNIKDKINNKERVSLDFPDLKEGNDNIIKLLNKDLLKLQLEIAEIETKDFK